jgi:hypothetical protein
MGYIPSSTTVYSVAYLTDIGRNYLFNQGNIRYDQNGNDLFQVVAFSLGDPDKNYNSNVNLTSGEVPDISGKGEGCLKGAADSLQNIQLYYQVNIVNFTNVQYITNQPGNTITINSQTL